MALAIAFGALVFSIEWYRHFTFRSGTLDLGYFDQAVWLMAHGHEPFVTLIGRNIFADHFSPALLVFVPFYAVVSTPLWLLAGQALALAIGLLALRPLLDELHVDPRWQRGFVAAYVLSPMLWLAAVFDFHMSTLAVPFLLMGITAALRDDRRGIALQSILVLLMRDDLGLAVIALALVGFTKSAHRPFRVGVAVIGLLWIVIAGQFGQAVDSPQLWQAHYGYLGVDASDAAHHLLRSMARAAQEITSKGNLFTAGGWLLAFGFLPLLSPRRAALAFLGPLPLFASAQFSNAFPVAHHAAPVFPFLLLGAATAVSRWRHPRLLFFGRPILIACAVAFLWAINPFGRYLLDNPHPDHDLAEQALRHIRPTDGVTATRTLGPHLSHRTLLLQFPYPFVEGDSVGLLDRRAAFVSADAVSQIDAVAIYYYNDGNSARVRQAFLRSPFLRGFRRVFDQEGLLVYTRDTP